jgi:hypothetical protein
VARLIAALFCVLLVQGAGPIIHYNTLPQPKVEERLRAFEKKNELREEKIHALFEQAGCPAERLKEQAVKQEVGILRCQGRGQSSPTDGREIADENVIHGGRLIIWRSKEVNRGNRTEFLAPMNSRDWSINEYGNPVCTSITGSTLSLKGASHWPQARNRLGASKGASCGRRAV